MGHGKWGIYITNFCLIYIYIYIYMRIRDEEKDFFLVGGRGVWEVWFIWEGIGWEKWGILVINVCLISRGRKGEV